MFWSEFFHLSQNVSCILYTWFLIKAQFVVKLDSNGKEDSIIIFWANLKEGKIISVISHELHINGFATNWAST